MGLYTPTADESNHSGRTASTVHVDNVHSQSCVDSITRILSSFVSLTADQDLEKAERDISDINVSLPHRTVFFTHPENLDLNPALQQLDNAGFDVRLGSGLSATSPIPSSRPFLWRSLLKRFSFQRSNPAPREIIHRDICGACIAVARSGSDGDKASNKADKPILHETRLSLPGMTCSSCTSAISSVLSSSSERGVRSCQITTLPPSVLVIHDSNILTTDNLRRLIEDAGYGTELISSNEIVTALVPVDDRKQEPSSYKAIYSILGMTCVSCVSSVVSAMESVSGTTAISVDLMGKTGSAVVKCKEDADLIRIEVEDTGFECAVVDLLEQHDTTNSGKSAERTITVRIGGMSCGQCVTKVNKTLGSFSHSHLISFAPISLDNPITTLTYMPALPSFSLRIIRDDIVSLGFTLSVVHVDSIEERAARARAREQRNILLRVVITLLFAIPTFIVAVVGMSLLAISNPFRTRLEMPLWGNASHGTVVLFALATPVQVGVGWFFYERAWKSLKGVWRKRKADADWRRVWLERLFRWGSMDSLVSLGTSTGYLASLALMILDIRTTPQEGVMGGEMGWFDSSVFLMLFILAGRYLESVSKQRTGDAISTLSSTKPSTGLLYTHIGSSTTEEPVDFLEVGDTLLVPVGASPPLDAVLTSSSPHTTFDEASLTGEARPVLKTPGDEVFAGTTNAGPAAAVVTVTNETGKTMLDGIVGIVRDAMGKKAGIERIADIVTGYFVPFVVGVAALTFGVWCLRGYLGDLPSAWLTYQGRGAWALFAVQFGVAVLVVACPCGIGLAAPTAQLVGVGLAAQNGILSNGGGEAFQAISSLDTVVLDKTGTLTTSKFTVSDNSILTDSSSRNLVCSMLRAAEQASTHPLAVGVREWCQAQLVPAETSVDLISSEEIPGRGLVAVLVVEGNKLEVAIGNEKLMDDVEAEYESASASTQANSCLLAWQTEGKSVVILSTKLVLESSSNPLPLPITSDRHAILGLFGVHDPPRPEASTLVAELHRLNMDVWMISGDNPITAKTVARSVGIDESHVVAGALPADKRTWVEQLQNGKGRTAGHRKSWWNSQSSGRRIVAFCGDGINDAPAIAQADVGLAMGGGSNVAISTADFSLLSSSLLSILTVYHLARATRRKIISNFVWACLYNFALMPLAAGAFYSLGRTRLPPVWGSAAMAMSSVSVVVNSLFLRWTYRPPRAVREWSRNAQTSSDTLLTTQD